MECLESRYYLSKSTPCPCLNAMLSSMEAHVNRLENMKFASLATMKEPQAELITITFMLSSVIALTTKLTLLVDNRSQSTLNNKVDQMCK
jgi:hypothetical protein